MIQIIIFIIEITISLKSCKNFTDNEIMQPFSAKSL